MYVLTCNKYPIYVSEQIEKLINKRNELIKETIINNYITIIFKTEKSISYYNNLTRTYMDDIYDIKEIDVL